MKRLSLALLSAAVLLACAASPGGEPAVNEEAVREVCSGFNAFATDLYREVADKPGNVVLSPASVAIALGMVHAGAEGETADEIAGALHVGRPVNDLHAAIGEILRRWNRPEGYELSVANRLFGDGGVPFAKRYLDVTRRSFDAPLETMDFRGDPGGSRQRINGWVEEQTRRKIRDLLSEGAVTPLTRLVLVNAVYFKAQWVEPFPEAATAEAEFRAPAGPKRVPMMNAVATYRYAASPAERVRLLDIPYRGRAFAMTIVLPDDVEGLGALEGRLDAKRLGSWIEAMAGERVRLRLPKFKIEMVEPLTLSRPLRALGVERAFDPATADLGAMATSGERLFVSEGFHKAFIEIDEKGTEAAAATALGIRATSAPPQRDPVPFVVDRPFLYLIRDTRTGAILFLGRVEDPSAG